MESIFLSLICKEEYSNLPCCIEIIFRMNVISIVSVFEQSIFSSISPYYTSITPFRKDGIYACRIQFETENEPIIRIEVLDGKSVLLNLNEITINSGDIWSLLIIPQTNFVWESLNSKVLSKQVLQKNIVALGITVVLHTTNETWNDYFKWKSLEIGK